MSNFYQTLGVQPNASDDEIKKAYRKLAMSHHPDRGGDDNTFQKISEAYTVLGDPQKRAEYDMAQRGGPQVHFTTQGFDFGQMFGHGHPFQDIFGAQFGGRGHQRRNRDLNLHCEVALKDAFTGKQLEASFQTPGGKSRTVVINVPAGVEHGSTIRFEGLGDDSMPGVPPGALNVTIIVHGDEKFQRSGNDLYTTIEITPIEAMIGCTRKVTTITGQITNLDIRAGVETGTEFAVANQGFTNINDNRRGRFVCIIKIKGVAVTDKTTIDQLTKIQNSLTSK